MKTLKLMKFTGYLKRSTITIGNLMSLGIEHTGSKYTENSEITETVFISNPFWELGKIKILLAGTLETTTPISLFTYSKYGETYNDRKTFSYRKIMYRHKTNSS